MKHRTLLAAALAVSMSVVVAAPAHGANCTANGGTPLETAINNVPSPGSGTLTIDQPSCTPPASGYTILNRTITLQGAAGGTAIDGAGLSSGSRILLLNGAETSVVRDITFRNGDHGADGGGLSVEGNSSPTLERLQFYGNGGDGGGAMRLSVTAGSTPIVIRDSTFGSAAAADANTAAIGGAVHANNVSRPVQVTGSRFVGNSAQVGGALNLTAQPGVSVTVASNSFSGNTALTTGGAVHLGCGIKTFTNNTLVGNHVSDPAATGPVHRGGGLAVITCADSDPLTQSGNLFSGNSVTFGAASTGLAAGAGEFAGAEVITSRNDRFVGNQLQVPGASAEGEGSGLALEGCGPGLLQGNHRVENAVVAGNSFTGTGAGERSGALYVGCSTGSANLTVLDSSVAGNTGGGGTAGLFGGPDDVLTMHNSVVAGNSGGTDLTGFASKAVTFSDACPLLAGAGNLCANPLLANAAGGDVHQTAASPTLDRGSNAQVPAGLTTDFEGGARIQGPAVDIGADESVFAAAAAQDATAPGVTGARLTNSTFAVARGATPVTVAQRKRKRRVKRGTTIRYTLSEAATVRLRIDRRLAGRRVRRKGKRVCVKPTRKNRKRRKCTRYKRAGRTLIRTSKTGKNRVKFSGRIGRKALKRGRYRLTIVATDAAGNKSKTKRLGFRVVKP